MDSITNPLKGNSMAPINRTPVVGEVLTYRDSYRHATVVLPVKVAKVWAAACQVEILAGGLDNSLKGKTLRVHVCQLYK